MTTDFKRTTTAKCGNGDSGLVWERANLNHNSEAQYIIIIQFKMGALYDLLEHISSTSEQALIIAVLMKLLPDDAPKKDYMLLSDSLLTMRRGTHVVNGNFYNIHHNAKVGG